MINFKPNSELLEEINEKVEGHIKAKKVLINLFNRSKIRYQQKLERVDKEDLLLPSKCLLIGASGTGKTFLVDTMANILDIPLIKLDATKFNPVGAGGGVKAEQITRLVYDNAREFAKTHKGYENTMEGAVEQTVVFVDEIDKLAESWDGCTGWNKHTQSHFLTVFENNKELAGVSFIFAGAFTGLDKMKEQSNKRFGFTNRESLIEEQNYCLDELIVKYGLIPELVGRINNIVELDMFTKDDYFDILVNRLLPAKEQEYYLFNFIEHTLVYEQLKEMANKAFKSGMGVRYLQRALNDYFTDLEFDYEDRMSLSFKPMSQDSDTKLIEFVQE